MDNQIESYMRTDDGGATFIVMCPMCDVPCWCEDTYDGPTATCEQCGEGYYIW